jgi:hypothetical protein
MSCSDEVSFMSRMRELLRAGYLMAVMNVDISVYQARRKGMADTKGSFRSKSELLTRSDLITSTSTSARSDPIELQSLRVVPYRSTINTRSYQHQAKLPPNSTRSTAAPRASSPSPSAHHCRLPCSAAALSLRLSCRLREPSSSSRARVRAGL